MFFQYSAPYFLQLNYIPEKSKMDLIVPYMKERKKQNKMGKKGIFVAPLTSIAILTPRSLVCSPILTAKSIPKAPVWSKLRKEFD
jgi:hypothetical protein